MKEGAKKLFVIDGSSLLYRSYYAIKRLANSKGFPTNAIYGFLLTLRKLIDQEKPHLLGVVFDVKGPTVRHKAYPDYKANRKPMPEDLQVQVPVLKKILQAYHIPLFEYPEYEGDDILGSLTRQATERGVPSVIISTDKDLLQLVDGTVVVYNPAKEVYLDEAGVQELFGVKPSQVRDVLSLWGDPSDNVPGVPGVGEKISKNLIAEFGSLDKLLKNLDKIKNPRVREAIKDNLDKLELSRRLVTIERGLALDFNLEAFVLSEPDTGALSALFQELEFSSLLSEVSKPAPDLPLDYRLIQDEAALGRLVQRIKKEGFVSLDTETDSPHPIRARLVGMSFSVKPGEAFYLPLRHDYPGAPAQVQVKRALAALQEVLTSSSIRKIGQNIKYDALVLRREGVELRGIDLDSMVLSYLLEPNWGKHNKEKLALSYLGLQAISYAEVAGKGKEEATLNAVAVDKTAPYACQDADLALRLSRLLWTRVQEKGLDRLYRDTRAAADRGPGRYGEKRRPGRSPGAQSSFSGAGRGDEAAREEDFRAHRPGVQPELPPPARPGSFRKNEPALGQEDQNHQRLFDLLRRPAGPGSSLAGGPARPRIPSAGQAQVHLCRLPPGAGQPRDGARPHLL